MSDEVEPIGRPVEYDVLDDLAVDYEFANDPVVIERLWVDEVLPAPDGQVAVVLMTRNLATGKERLDMTFVRDFDAEQS